MSPVPSRLSLRSAEDLASVTLESRATGRRGEGMSAMEAVAWLCDEPPSQSPRCASRVLAGFVESCNDRWPDAERQLLKPYLPLLVGTRSSPALEHRRAYLLTDRAVRLWALAAARNSGRLARQWGSGIRANADRLAALAPLREPPSALRAAAIAFATADEVQSVAGLVEACALAGENAVASAHAGAHALAAEAIGAAARGAQALAAGATYVAAAAATEAVEATEATALAAAHASHDATRFDRQETVARSLAALEALLSLTAGPEQAAVPTYSS